MLPKILSLENPIQQASATTVNMGSSFLFDFTTGDFVLEDGKLVKSSDTKALQIWIEKALKTQLNQYEIYSGTSYGANLEDLIGESLPFSFVESELRREITNCLTQHPNIISVSGFAISREGSWLNVSFTVNTTYNQSISQEVNFIV